MAILTEEEVYNGTKRFLKDKLGYHILGGQPPRGVNHLPVIEVKSGTNLDKGSRGAYKPDLIAFNQGVFLIVECKPTYCQADVDKLEEILQSDKRLNSLFAELKQRGCLSRIGYEEGSDVFRKHVKGAHAYSGDFVDRRGICHITVKDFHGEGCMKDLSSAVN